MALIIDGSTYPGFWKFSGDHTLPNEFQLVAKHAEMVINSTNATEMVIIHGGTSYTTDTSTIDEFGNALDTSVKVARYLSDNR